LAWILFLLVVAGVASFLVWDYRRKTAQREAASQERFEQMFKGKAAVAPASGSVPAAVVPAAAPVAASSAVPKAPSVATKVPARERFIGQPETLIYYLLKTGVPDHEVFANVTLASVVGAPGTGSEREQQLRRLSQYQLDFVICDKRMRIVAVVDVDTPAGVDAASELRVKSDYLGGAGIRFVRINPTSLPPRDAIRGLVCGVPNAADK